MRNRFDRQLLELNNELIQMGSLIEKAIELAIAALVKQHNNANVIALGGRFTDVETAKKIVDAYIDAEFEGGRHQGRIDKIMALEKC